MYKQNIMDKYWNDTVKELHKDNNLEVNISKDT